MSLTSSDKVYHREIILKKRNEVLAGLSKELNEGVHKVPELKSSLGSDIGDMSTLNTSSDLSAAIAARYADMLREIDQALSKLEEGTYGLCEECGEEIDGRRLEALPFTPYCLQCQKKIEEDRKKRRQS
ncbi:MAG: TraR/DksA family transcriptional regulator [Deltaproteobacteria bacterium]|nr:MAG: TraR/DksA family transcriptional regulator [Deltaproteobacteria bacterium]